MITRVRLEGIGDRKTDVQTYLWAAFQRMRDSEGGSWHKEDEEYVGRSRSGFWGRLTVRRDGEGADDFSSSNDK